MIVHVPHSSPVIPPAIRTTLKLTDEELQHELFIMTDWFTDTLFRVPDETATTLVFPVSRLVVDPERFLDDEREPMAAKGMGAVYTTTSNGRDLRQDLSREERNWLLTTYYYPHQERARDAVRAALADRERCLLVDAHSFASKPLAHESDQTPNRCQVCIGTDDFQSPPRLVEWLTAAFRRRGFDVAINQPFSGTFIPMDFYRREPRAASIMIELNRSLYLQEDTAQKHAGFGRVQTEVRGILMELSPVFASGTLSRE
jgi:N-formylglutamate amidohydrolase